MSPPAFSDLAFTLHMLSWLAVNGTSAIVEFPGVLYRGGVEGYFRARRGEYRIRYRIDEARRQVFVVDVAYRFVRDCV